MQSNKLESGLVLSDDDIKFLCEEIQGAIIACANSIFSLDFRKEKTPRGMVCNINKLILEFVAFLRSQEVQIIDQNSAAHKTLTLFCKVHYYIQQCLLYYMKLRNLVSSTQKSQEPFLIQRMEFCDDVLEKSKNARKEALDEVKLCFNLLKKIESHDMESMYSIISSFKSFLVRQNVSEENFFKIYFDLLEKLYIACRSLLNHNMKEITFAELSLEDQRKTGAICKIRNIERSLRYQKLLKSDDPNNNNILIEVLPGDDGIELKPDSLLAQASAMSCNDRLEEIVFV